MARKLEIILKKKLLLPNAKHDNIKYLVSTQEYTQIRQSTTKQRRQMTNLLHISAKSLEK